MCKPAVVISINPKWCKLIISGKKTIEVRKTEPKMEPPFKCYIYETKGRNGRGKVIGEFMCNFIFEISCSCSDTTNRAAQEELPYICMTSKELIDYLGYREEGYGWNISDLVIYHEPKELSKFRTYCASCGFPILPYQQHPCDACPGKNLKNPPQSWCYTGGKDAE